MSLPRPQPALSLPLSRALGDSAPLAQLLARVQASRERYELVRSLLPPALQGAVRPGPLDEGGWSLLADGSAAAAKLRQLLPQLQATLRAAGQADLEIKVKVLPRSA